MLTEDRIYLSSVLTEKYENFLIRYGFENDKNRKHDHFHPSSFGQCFRKTAFQYYLFPKDEEISPKARRIFSTGHAHHHRMQTDFTQMGILRGYWKCRRCGKIHGEENKWGIFCPYNCSCAKLLTEDFPGKNLTGNNLFEYREMIVKNEEYCFEGHCDGIVELVKNDDDERYVIDFKTVKSEKFSFLKNPDPVYIVQIRIYMWILGIQQGIIFYEEKNTHGIKEFVVRQDENHIAEIKNNAKKLWEVLKAKKLPAIPKLYSKDQKPCLYCEYKEKCWSKLKG